MNERERGKVPLAGKKWDVFISHASEDKESFVRPLAVSLRRLGVEVWYDEFSLKVGDSLSRSIDRGLADSKFGLVVISPNFVGKAWPERELAGLVSREIEEGRVIIPIWHGVSKKQVLEFSPPFADKIAIRTGSLNAEEIAIQALCEIRPDLYEKHPRSELQRLVSGEALNDLQQELEETKDELSEYRCPFCGDSLVSWGPTEDGGDWKEFGCGHQSGDGYHTQRPCPSDPKFPQFEDYEIISSQSSDGSWWCYTKPKTDMARRLSFSHGGGRTKEEAEKDLRSRYDYCAKRRKNP